MSSEKERQENYEKLLSTHHGRMIDFVKFAEAKNAALVTFCSFWVGSILTVLRFNQTLPLAYENYLTFALPILIVAALVSLAAFFPRLLHHFHKRGDGPRNLLFFGDVASFTAAAYGARLRERYYPPEGAAYTNSYLDDLEVQIAVQAAIAHRKFRFFNWAAGLVMLAFVFLAVPAIWEAIRMGVHFGTAHGWF